MDPQSVPARTRRTASAVRPELFLGPVGAELVRREIRRAHGAEVCFVARVGDDGEVLDPRAVARGNSGAVLAAIRNPEPGGVVLHNHPSGTLLPSEADLGVAAQLWEQGLGFAICDNAASELYVVVEPPSDEPLDLLDPDQIDADLGPLGPLARRHPRYEDRPQQRDMARGIAELYNTGGVGLFEAGTGTGKSVAYLVPAIRWALQNRERTVVSTATINLQEQLVDKDLPLLRRALGEPFRFALVKGRRNYISIRRARLAALSAPALLDDGKQAELKALTEWMGTTRDGSLQDLPFTPSADVWDEVASESDICLRAKCPNFEECFYQRTRREAAAADVVVVNHNLLFSDLSVRRQQGNYTAPAVLPHYRRLILDEAHNIEDAATRHLGGSTSRRGLARVLRRLEHRGKGILPALLHGLRSGKTDLLGQAAVDLVEGRLLPALESARLHADRVWELLENVLHQAGATQLRLGVDWAEHPVWEIGLEASSTDLLRSIALLLEGLEALRERMGVDEEVRATLEPQLLELRGVWNRLDTAAEALRGALRRGDDADLQLVRWLERRADSAGGAANVTLTAVPLDLAGLLRDSIWDKIPTVVLASATLATRRDFGFVRGRLGIARGEDRTVREAILPSPFDYTEQALLVAPTDIPAPSGDNDRRHDEATIRATLAMAEITDGGLFVLFTSYRQLRHTAAELRRRGADLRWPLWVHGEMQRAELVERFAASGNGILLGTTSFWEGVDVPGNPLRGLVIPKLPFRVPTEPITAARVEAIEARGGNAFTSYMLPHAAIRLKQGFGRLIRSRLDHGAVLLLDPRVATKPYGRYLLESLPPAPVVAAPWQQVRAELERFYAARAAVAESAGADVWKRALAS